MRQDPAGEVVAQAMLDDELLDLLHHGRPPQLGAAFAAVELLRNEAFVPAHEGVWRGGRGDLFEALPTERVSERRERRRSVSVRRSRRPPSWAFETRCSS